LQIGDEAEKTMYLAVRNSIRITLAAFLVGTLGVAGMIFSTGGAAVAAPPVAHTGTTCNAYLPAGSVVAMAATPDDGGYWIASRSGEVVSCGDAMDYGSLSTAPNQPIVGMTTTPDGLGYWLVASDGGIFSFGDATFYGSTGNIHLNKPVVGLASTPTGSGYWLVATDGGIFAFNVPFYGSMGAVPLNKPVVGMALDGATGGYWMVAADGGIFSFNAPFFGSTGAISLNQPIVGMEANSVGSGYRFVASDGGIFSFGASGFFGSAVAPPAATPPPPTPGPGAPSCAVTMSSANPAQNSVETANITSSVPNTAVSVVAHYKTTTSSYGGTTDGAGSASVSFPIGSATVARPVPVDVTIGAASCTTSFTPA
jgi:hypothetical protein